MKEFIRKRLVALKRKPQTIALLGLAAAFVYFSFNLTQVSDTTASFQMNGMGLSAFVIMLFSVLVLVCFLNAFPHRKKVNIPMLVLMFLMLGAIIFCNVYYDNCIDQAIQARWDDAYNKHVSDAVEAVGEARESSLTNAELAVESAEALESTKAAVAAVTAAVEETTAIADELAAAAEAPAEKARAAAEAAAAALVQAEEALTSVETASATIAANAAEVEAAAAAAEAAPDLKTAKAEGKDAAAVVKKSKNVAKNVDKAAKKADEALAAAEEALLNAKAALAESKGEEFIPEQPAEAPAEAAAEEKQPAEETEIVLSDALYAEAKQKGDDTVTSLLAKDAFINATSAMMDVHRIILIVALALVALLPVYTPMLRKIRTSIEVEANEDMGEIELNGSDD